jgi:hypothetical protein
MGFVNEIIIVVIQILHGKKKVPSQGLLIYLLHTTRPLTFGMKSKSSNRYMWCCFSLLWTNVGQSLNYPSKKRAFLKKFNKKDALHLNTFV